jgi:hypothetical protein
MTATTADARRILSFIYETTDAINQYKYITANFLDDNDSISSIPRNYRSIRDKHLAWLGNHLKYITSNAPDWNSILDAQSYQVAVEKIRNFETNISSDAALSSLELQFISDLMTIQNTLVILKKKINSLLSSRLLTTVKEQLGQDALDLENNLNQSRISLSFYVNNIIRVCSQIRLFISRRIYLKTSVPTTWNQILDLRLSRINEATANQIIEEIERSLNGPKIRADIQAELSNMQTKASALLNIYFSPYLARRAALGGLARIQELEDSLPTQLITIDESNRIHAILSNSMESLQSVINSITQAKQHLPLFVEERVSEVKSYLNNNSRKLSGECKNLGESIVYREIDIGNIFEQTHSESNFVVFKDKCDIPIE